MKKWILFLGTLLIGTASLYGQVIYQEDFESGDMPDSWSIQTNASDGGWSVGTPAALSSAYFTIEGNGSNYVAATNDDACNCDKSNEYLISPALDLSNVETAVFSFDAFYLDNTYQGAQEDATIEVSLDGMNWEVLEDLHGHASWDRHSIDLSPYAGESTVYIGFRYDDDAGWLYGLAIDNVTLEVPSALDAELVELNKRGFGEVGLEHPISGTIYNAGGNTITSLEITYSVDGNENSENLDGLSIAPFSYYEFESAMPWIPQSEGIYTLEATITAINGGTDENPGNNSASYDTEIFEQVIVPNRIDEFLSTEPVIEEMSEASASLDKPTDLDFFPIMGKDELWIINQRNENSGGSTLTISDAADGPSEFLHRVDGNAWHFMSLPTGIAFSDDNFNFASSPGVQDANHNGGTFTGPTLWSSDPEIYAQPSGGNGSHLDMLHGSPFSMGIAHEVDNVFWVYDDWHGDIVRYDFVDDHGPGNDYHGDALIRRYRDIGINKDADIPNHMILDKATGWLYFVDNGNDRVIRLDINSGGVSNALPLINEPLTEHSQVSDFDYEVIIETGLDRPCGIEIIENRLLVGDYATGDIIVYDMDNSFAELGRIPTMEEGLTGIKVGPEGNIWYTNRLQNSLNIAQPGVSTSTTAGLEKGLEIGLAPNPTTGKVFVKFQSSTLNTGVDAQVQNTTGKVLLQFQNVQDGAALDLSTLPNGVYLVVFRGSTAIETRKVVVSH